MDIRITELPLPKIVISDVSIATATKIALEDGKQWKWTIFVHGEKSSEL